MHLPGQDLRQEEGFLPRSAVDLQRRPHRLECDGRQRDVGPGRFIDENLLLDLAEPAAAVFLRPAQAQPAVAAHPPDHIAVDEAEPRGEHRLALGR